MNIMENRYAPYQHMQEPKPQNSKEYLDKFDEILNNMSNQMLSQNITNSITINFIRCMIPHHQAAIYMCENLLKYTNFKPLQDIAHNIIKMQTAGIEQMREIASTTCGFYNTRREVNWYYRRYLQITRNMIEKMKNAPRCENINLNFINEMIPHHEGAVEMCNNLLQYRIDPRLAKVAKNIIDEQSKGIQELEALRNTLCKKSSYQ